MLQTDVSSFPSVPQLLVSVRNLQEAETCLGCGVGILDFKEPSAGALGRVDELVLREAANLIRCRQAGEKFKIRQTPSGQNPPLSFAAGELLDWQFETFPRLLDCYGESLLGNFHYVKVGLAGLAKTNWTSRWCQLFDGLPTGCHPVAVCYADHQRCSAPSIDRVLRHAIDQPKVKVLLLDTYHKDQNLLASVDAGELKNIIRQCHANNLQIVIAGSLNLDVLPVVAGLKPDFVGVRGAVCDGDRSSSVSLSKLLRLCQQLSNQPPVDKKMVRD